MNFGPDHYVPVLKVKQGEKAALLEVDPAVRPRIIPLLEIVERNPDKSPTVQAHVNTAFKNLAGSVQSYRRCFLDTREIFSDGSGAAQAVFHRAARDGIVFTPVTGISRTHDVAAALSYRTNGTAVRLTTAEFESGRLARNLNAFITAHGLRHAEVDLIVDLGAVDHLVQAGVETLAQDFLAEVPDQPLWRTLIISACAFPSNLGMVGRNSYEFVERNEWLVWRDQLYACRLNLARLPTFSDCAIQHPKGVEGFDFRTMQASAAIRYALPEHWLIIKGVGTRSTRPSDQFPELAKRLVYGQFRPYFRGLGHCRGCSLMKNAADGFPNLGSAGKWRLLGTIHHVMTVMEGLGALPWP